MSGATPTTLDRLRQPEYTGENRCLPCTFVNVLIAVAISVPIGFVSPPVGGAVLIGSLAAIYLRGYLVPGTPTLTKRYLPDSVLARFDKGPEIGVPDEAPDDPEHEFESIKRRREAEQIDPEPFLSEIGAVEPCAEVDDLCPTDEFAADWREHMDAYRDDPMAIEPIAALLDAEPEDVSIKEEREYPAFAVDRTYTRVRPWLSDEALVADLAANAAIADRSDTWGDVFVDQRLDVLKALRSFLDECPTCGGAITVSERTVESCCRQGQVVGFTCEDCETRLLELDPTNVGVKSATPD